MAVKYTLGFFVGNHDGCGWKVAGQFGVVCPRKRYPISYKGTHILQILLSPHVLDFLRLLLFDATHANLVVTSLPVCTHANFNPTCYSFQNNWFSVGLEIFTPVREIFSQMRKIFSFCTISTYFEC